MTAALSTAVKSFLKAHLPRGANLGPPVVQLFVNDGRQTHLSLINFPGFFAPRQAGEYSYRVWAYDPAGSKIGETVVALPRFGAVDISLAEVFGARLPAYGMVAVQIEPRASWFFADRHLGRIRPHFFTLYVNRNMESLGLVHPQTSLDAHADPARHWISNLQFDPLRLVSLEVFQVNPSRAALHSEVFLQDDQRNVVARSTEVIRARGAGRTVFDIQPLRGRCAFFSAGVHGLAAANGKPILFMHFSDKSFSCCHG